jgi:hypothetical protein
MAGGLTPEKINAVMAIDPKTGMELLKVYQEKEAAKNSPFAGTAFDSQVANLAYQEAISMGMGEFEAKKYAADKIGGNKTRWSQHPVSGALIPTQGKPYFGTGGQEQPAAMPPAAPSAVPPALSPLDFDGFDGGEPPQASGLYDQADKIAGPVSAASNLYSNVAGVIGLPIAEDVVEARQSADIASNQLVSALQQNPRFNEGERKAIKKEVGINPKAFESPPALQARLRAIDKSLATRLADEQRVANDPNQTPEMRKGALQAIEAIGRYRAAMGVPQSNGAPQAGGGKIRVLRIERQ